YDFHVQHKAKMVPFAGYSMPLSYGETGQSKSHRPPLRHSTALTRQFQSPPTNTSGQTPGYLTSLICCSTILQALLPRNSS
ncbi:hypothetical protein, partial [Nocardiopsis aegyptia]